MPLAIKALKIFAAIWAGLVGLSFLVWAVQLWMEDGLPAVWHHLSPFNLDNLLLLAFSFAPAIVAFILADVLGETK